MPVRVRRKALLAYVLFLSSGCLVLWAILFISSHQSVSTFASIDLTAEDKFNFPFLDEEARKTNVLAISSKIFDSGLIRDVKLMSELDVIQNKTILRALSWEELSAVYHSYVNKNQLECENVERVGRVTDGGWDVCTDSAYLSKSDCIVYSFGVDNDFSFDDAAISKFGCMVHSFDPSMEIESKKRGDKAFFYHLGLADSDRTLANGWPMAKFENIRTSLKHSKTNIAIVKLDIEEYEWEVLPDLLTSEQLQTVNQLLIELHQCEGCSVYNPQQTDKEPSREHYIHMLEIMAELYRQNFRIFHHHANQACRYLSKFSMSERTACYELGFVRVS